MARNFDGIDDKIRIENSPVVGTPFTMACWFRCNSPEGGVLMTITDGGGDNNWFRMFAPTTGGDSIGTPMRFDKNGGGFNGFEGVNSSNYLQWNFGAFASRGVGLEDTYVKINDTPPTTGQASGTPGGIDRYTLGVLDRPSITGFYKGDMAYPMLYNRVLSNDELNQIRDYPASVTKGLSLFHPLINFSGTAVPDWSVKNQPGTATGTTHVANDPDGPPISGLWRPKVHGWEYSHIPADAPAPAAGVDESFVFSSW